MSTTNKWAELFRGRKWRVLEEATGQVRRTASGGSPVTITYHRGVFTFSPPGSYSSPLSTNKGRRGLVLQETDAAGTDDIPGSRIVVGEPAVKRARDEFGAVW